MKLSERLTNAVVQLFFVFLSVSCALADEHFIRVLRDARGTPVSLESSIAEYENGSGVRMSLVSAVHIADTGYYKKLNHELKKCGAVLYELVAPKDTVPKAGESDNALSGMQQLFKTMLGLDFQLDSIDYSAANFVHADMDPFELSRTMEARDESLVKLIVKVAAMGGAGGLDQGKNGPPDLSAVLLLGGGKRPLALKRLLAPEFGGMESLAGVIENAGGSSIVSARNDKVLKVAKKEILHGKRNLCIFYGGAHMPDLQKKLVELGFVFKNERWLTAWDMKG